MNARQETGNRLPLRQPMGPAFVLSLITALFMAGTYAAGLLYQSYFYPAGDLILTCVPNDAANLIIGLPLLAVSMILARRGSLAGLLCWPGALLFVVYNEIAYLLMMPRHWGYLAHLCLAMLAAYTAAGILMNLDGREIRKILDGALPVRVAGGILAGMGAVFLIRAAVTVINGILHPPGASDTEFAVLMADFIVSPAWILGGVLLWRRRDLGYALGPGLLFQAGMLFVALTVFLILQPVLTDASLAAGDIAVIFAMGLVCIVPFILVLRGIVRSSGSR